MSYVHLLFKSLALWAILCAVSGEAAAATVKYRFTARSFLPAACMQEYDQVNAAWTYAHLGKITNADYPSDNARDAYVGGSTGSFGGVSGTDMCKIWDDIADRTFNGHPDFEPSGRMYAEGCSGGQFNLTSSVYDGTQCTPVGAANITKIVENDFVDSFHEDGLPKPKYCIENESNFPDDPRCGWSKSPGSIRVSTTGKEYFDKWFRDDAVYNMRAGFTLTLTEIETGIFQYTAPPAGFFPLAQNFPATDIKPCSVTGRRLDCSNGGKAFPRATKIGEVESASKVFSFTSEHHSFFQLQGTERFTFKGDDDVWVFLNERLAVDVGGLHPSATSTIDLSNEFVRQQLGMEIGGFYALDMYHAERHTHESNFQITTGLTSGCNIVRSGKSAYEWDPDTIDEHWKLIGGPTWGIVDSDQIVLTSSAEFNTVGYAFLRQQMNVGGGFVVNFKFTATTPGEGFVFVLKRDDIIDMNGGSGGHLGFKNTENSLGIVFDFCVDRDTNVANPACKRKELRAHFLDNGGLNNAGAETRKLRAPLYLPFNLTDGNPHSVTINYFFKSPDWLEVIVDDDLMLQQRRIDLDQVLGGRNAFVGFTASTGVGAASTIRVFDVSVSTIGIEDRRTQTLNLPNETSTEPLLNATADGRRFVDVVIQNFDDCEGKIEFGGFGDRAKGILTLVEEDNSTSAGSSFRSLADNSTEFNGTVLAEIVDDDNGKYLLRFRTTVPGVYDLQLWYGVGCFEGGNNTGEVLPVIDPNVCYTYSRPRTAVFSPVIPPTAPPEVDDPQGLPQAAITGIGVAAGVVGVVGSILLVVGIRFRNRWRKEKAFIDAGKLAVAERGVDYLGDSDLDALQQRLQGTLHALQAERAKKLREGDKQAAIDELLRQKGELQETVRRLKIKMAGGDPNEPVQTLGARMRKSFAASRVSRGISMRLSRGFSLAAPTVPEETQLSSGNPLFNRMSQAFGRKPAPPPVLPEI